MAAAREIPQPVKLVKVVAHNRGSGRRDRRRISLHFRHGSRQIEALRKIMLRIVNGGFVLVADAEVERDFGAQLPIVLEIHTIELNVRIWRRTANHFRCAVKRAQQECRKLVAVEQRVRIVERICRESLIEIKVRSVGYVAEAVAFPLLKARLEIRSEER